MTNPGVLFNPTRWNEYLMTRPGSRYTLQCYFIYGEVTYFCGVSVVTTDPIFWRHNEHDGVSNHQHHDCLPNCLFRRRSKITSKLCVTGLCAGNSPVTGEFPAQMASYTENVPIWWRHHALGVSLQWILNWYLSIQSGHWNPIEDRTLIHTRCPLGYSRYYPTLKCDIQGFLVMRFNVISRTCPWVSGF